MKKTPLTRTELAEIKKLRKTSPTVIVLATDLVLSLIAELEQHRAAERAARKARKGSKGE